MEDVPLFPKPPAVTVERTLAIIKPDAIHCVDEIIEEIKSHGFTILQVAHAARSGRACPLEESTMFCIH